MASRKSRSRRTGATATRARTVEHRGLVSSPIQPATATSPSDASQVEPAIEWSSEYHYLVNDLRQLLLVSVGLFALMLVVGYFL